MMQLVLILVVALQGLLLSAPINSSLIVRELSTQGSDSSKELEISLNY